MSSCLPLAFEEKNPCMITRSLFSDQTPTPTRFLKNCEEVGLFNELDCSLEHEFRKAQEEESSKRVGLLEWTPWQVPPPTPVRIFCVGTLLALQIVRMWPENSILSICKYLSFFFFFKKDESLIVVESIVAETDI